MNCLVSKHGGSYSYSPLEMIQFFNPIPMANQRKQYNRESWKSKSSKDQTQVTAKLAGNP